MVTHEENQDCRLDFLRRKYAGQYNDPYADPHHLRWALIGAIANINNIQRNTHETQNNNK